jgi:hypothetical protein
MRIPSSVVQTNAADVPRARAENAQNCFLLFSLSTATASAVLFLINLIETNFYVQVRRRSFHTVWTQSGQDRCRLVKIFPERGLSPVKARH